MGCKAIRSALVFSQQAKFRFFNLPGCRQLEHIIDSIRAEKCDLSDMAMCARVRDVRTTERTSRASEPDQDLSPFQDRALLHTFRQFPAGRRGVSADGDFPVRRR